MPKTTYYAKVDVGYPVDNPVGLVRRIHTEPLPTDETFGRDLRWHPTEFLRRHYLGHNDVDPVEISEEKALELMARWQRKSGTPA